MIGNKKILAIIPARSGSKGLKNKNLKKINNIPLVGYPVIAAKKSKYIDKIIISSDSQKICNIASKYGADIPFLRPKELATDTSKRSEVILHCLENIKGYEIIIYLEPTSPLTNEDDIDYSLEKFIEYNASSLVSISESNTCHPMYSLKFNDNSKEIKPYLSDSFKNLVVNRQDLEKVYFFDGSLYISTVKKFLVEKEFYHDDTKGIILSGYKSIEIDDIEDFKIVEFLLNNLNEK